jgi:amidase
LAVSQGATAGSTLGDYLKSSPGSFVKSVEELLASDLHAFSLQGILEIANAQPEDYLTSDDYKNRLAERAAHGQAILNVMDDNHIDAIVYPYCTPDRAAGGRQSDRHNARLSARTGFPAITVPAGFTPSGFPIGVETLAGDEAGKFYLSATSKMNPRSSARASIVLPSA